MLSGAEFVLSPIGVTKIVSLLCMVIAGMIFITAGDCSESKVWAATYITVTTGSAVFTMVSYSSYALDLVKTDTGLKTQHITVLTISYVVFFILLIVSVITMTQCSHSLQAIQKVPEPLTIVAAVLLALCGTVLFLRWRATVQPEDPQELANTERRRTESQFEDHQIPLPRKSVMV